jgi:hypothetical protein
MSNAPTESDGKRALRDHAIERARLARHRHGPTFDSGSILRLLDDREFVRYPVGIRYDATGLQRGEFGHAEPLADHPRGGFCLFLHPALESLPELLPLAIAYHIPPVNYGDITEAEDCEAFGATLLGMDTDEYYSRLCALADSLD